MVQATEWAAMDEPELMDEFLETIEKDHQGDEEESIANRSSGVYIEGALGEDVA